MESSTSGAIIRRVGGSGCSGDSRAIGEASAADVVVPSAMTEAKAHVVRERQRILGERLREKFVGETHHANRVVAVLRDAADRDDLEQILVAVVSPRVDASHVLKKREPRFHVGVTTSRGRFHLQVDERHAKLLEGEELPGLFGGARMNMHKVKRVEDIRDSCGRIGSVLDQENDVA